MEKVRLTIQLRDHANMQRHTKKIDCNLNEVEEVASEAAHALAQNFPKPRKENKSREKANSSNADD